MSTTKLNIIAFDVPFPPDYGGAIDVYYRIKALHELGLEITLHCFEYGRGMPEELKDITHEIHYYRRRKSIFSWFSSLPFIVKTRSTKRLINNLLKNDSPILFEGIHSTFFLGDKRLQHRTKIVRTHNIEHDYYAQLAEQSSGFKKTFFNSEARKLKKYEVILRNADVILAIQDKDARHFKQYCDKTFVLPASIDKRSFYEFDNTKPYFLFHGNLSVKENEEGAKWLIEKVFTPLQWNQKLLVAGKNPSSSFIEFCQGKNVMITPNPDDLEMFTLLNLARVHVFYSKQNTGVKLKVLNALHTNGHIITNERMLEGSNLGQVCHVSNNPETYKQLVQDKITDELSLLERTKRDQFLFDNYNTTENCRKILLPLLQSS